MTLNTPEQIVDALLDHPAGVELRTLAYEITKIISSIRKASIFGEMIEKVEITPENLTTLDCMIEDFKTKTAELLQVNINATDSDLYDKVVYPLVIKQIERSA